MSLIGRSTTDTSHGLLLRTWRWSTRATRCCSATWPSTAKWWRTGPPRCGLCCDFDWWLRSWSHGDSWCFWEENMEKTWLKNLEIGSLTLNLEMIFHSNEMGILPPKSLGRDVKTNEEVETQIAEMWIISKHRDSRQRWDFTISPGEFFSMRFINFS